MNTTITPEQLELANEIKAFLDAHAKKIPDSDEYNSPDAYEFLVFSTLILSGTTPRNGVFSQWGAGGYMPLHDRKARELHDSLVKRSYEVIKRK